MGIGAMKNKVSILLLLVFSIALVLPLSAVFAAVDYSGGLLDGKTVTIGTGSTSAITDNNELTSAKIYYPNVSQMFYNFPVLADVSGLRLKADVKSRISYIRFYNSTGSILYDVPSANFTIDGSLVSFPTVRNVAKVAILTSDGTGVTISEFNVYGSEQVPADTTPPPVPTGLSGVAGDGHTSLTWSPVSASDLKGYYVYQNGVKINATPVTGTSYDVTGIANNQTYYFSVSSVDNAGNESARSAQVSSMFDTISPMAPIGLNVTGSSGTVNLTWTPNTEPDLAGYSVYEGSTKKNTALIIPASYQITGISDNVKYTFTVTATDSTGNESQKSLPVNYEFDTAAPGVPSGLTTAARSSAVELNWSPVTAPDLKGYFIYQDGVRVNDTPTDSTNYVVAYGLQNGQEYSFSVSSVDNAGNESARSAAVKATPIAPKIPAPTGLKVKAVGDKTVTITWTGKTGYAYNVYKNGVMVLDSPFTETTYTATGLLNGGSYTFSVSAVDESGNESAQTDPITISVSPPMSPPGGGTGLGSIVGASWGFDPKDIFTNGMFLVASVAGFVLLGIALMYVRPLIQMIWTAIQRRRRGY
jgi:fibronectin type 3 domain-containing protein